MNDIMDNKKKLQMAIADKQELQRLRKSVELEKECELFRGKLFLTMQFKNKLLKGENYG